MKKNSEIEQLCSSEPWERSRKPAKSPYEPAGPKIAIQPLDTSLVNDFDEQEPFEKRDFDFTDLTNLKHANFQNPFIVYLNINSLRYKITDLWHTLSSVGLELVAISETKLSSEFPDA